jgi:putative ABC transport system permease protein
VSALDRKLVRDLWQFKGQLLAICLVMSCGVATFVMSLCTLGSLERARDAYYARYHFADVFTHLNRAPNALAKRLGEIPGVARVQTRVVVGVNLDVPGFHEPALGRLISVPEQPGVALNGVHLRAGRHVEPGRTGEVLASEAFAVAHGLVPGDRVSAVINGRRQPLTIVGVALSPEYIYQILPGDLLPDARRFGIFGMGYQALAAAFNMEGAFNDVALGLNPDTSEPDVLQRLDRLTEPYGGLGAFGRKHQTSHEFLSNEVMELRGMAMIAPTIFLAVSAFLLNVVFSRLIRTQREQIAALKAFGYTRFEIGLHYLKMVLVMVLVGVVFGTVFGAWLGRGLTEMYTRFFRFPVFDFTLDPAVVALALLLRGGACVAGTLMAVRAAVRLPPAEAMRPEPPAAFRPTVVERLGLQWLFSPAGRMILRQLERQPVNAMLSVLGIATAVAVFVLGSFMKDAIDHVMESQWHLAQRQDVTVTLVEPASVAVLHEMRHLPGVTRAEPFRALGVRMRVGHHERRVGVMGLEPDADLNRLLDLRRRPVALPPDGLVLSRKLADLLGARVGDTVTVEVLEGERPVRALPVVGLIEDFAGTTGYMDRRAINRLMHEGDVVSGAFLAASPDRIDALYRELKQTPRAAGVPVKGAALASFRDTIAENLLRMRFFNVLFASIIAFGVVYNSARIALAERSRELATLRVIGFTRAEVSAILLGELGTLTLIAIPLGPVLGHAFAWLTTSAYDRELFRIPLVINPSTYATAALVVLASAVVSGLIVRHGLDRLELVSVLKAKE